MKDGFNYQQYLRTKSVYGITSVKAGNIEVIEKNKASVTSTIINNIKISTIEKVKSVLKGDTAKLCVSLLLGDKTELSENIQQNFRESNLSHILAISGAHISYILLGITTIIQKLKLHKRWGKIFLIIFLIFFMTLVGFTPSITRACIMAILQLISGILFRKSDTYQNLAISSFIILMANPYAFLDIGFHLFFGGTIGIIFFSNKLIKRKEPDKKIKEERNIVENKKEKFNFNSILTKALNNIKEMCIITLSANLLIIPIMMYHFNTISFTFLISNILASPILGISLVLGMFFIISLLFFKPLSILISFLLQPILQLLMYIADISSKLPFSQVLVPTPKIWQIILYYILLFILFFLSKKHQKVISIILIFLIISPYFIKVFPTNKLTINFIDVGQGDSMLIQTPSRNTILIDGGGSETGSFNVGEKTLLPYLLDKGILQIDYMIFSHFDSDHCQGLFTIMEKLKVKNAIIGKQFEDSNNYEEFIQIAREKKIRVYMLEAENRINIEKELYFDVLWPDSNNVISDNVLNNNSLLCKLVYKDFSMLFTGDIEEKAESAILQKYKDNLDILSATALKVAHHGSKTSSTTKFLEAVHPSITLIGVGEKNTFGHPSIITLENLQKINCKIYRTDEMGEITIQITNRREICYYKLNEK